MQHKRNSLVIVSRDNRDEGWSMAEGYHKMGVGLGLGWGAVRIEKGPLGQ